MKKILSFLVAIVALLPITFAQLNLKIDKTFAKQGLARIVEPNREFAFTHLHHFDNSNLVLAAGFYSDYDTEEEGWVFAKYKENGELDVTYAEKGILKVIGLEEIFYNILRIREASDKSILVLLGNSDSFNSDTTGIIRITPNGKRDTIFGNGGVLSAENGLFVDFDVLPDGKILALNNQEDAATLSIVNIFERYNATGTVDKTYGKEGSIIFNQKLEIFNRMERLGQSYLVMGASIDLVTFEFQPCVAKVSDLGVLNQAFGNTGIALSAPVPAKLEAYPAEVKILKDGTFLLYGFAYNTDTDSARIFLTEIKNNGIANTSFGKKGYLLLETSGAEEILLMDVEELASGKLLTSTTLGDISDGDMRISFQLFNGSGAKEKQFGTNGEIILNVEDKQSVICATEILPDGKILLAGGVFDDIEETFGAILTRFSLEYGVNTQEQTTLTASNIYPNPVSEWSTLSYELLENSVVNVQLYDLQGKMVQQLLTPQERSAGKQTESLEFNTALPQGQYLLKIDMADKGYKTLKVNKL